MCAAAAAHRDASCLAPWAQAHKYGTLRGGEVTSQTVQLPASGHGPPPPGRALVYTSKCVMHCAEPPSSVQAPRLPCCGCVCRAAGRACHPAATQHPSRACPTPAQAAAPLQGTSTHAPNMVTAPLTNLNEPLASPIPAYGTHTPQNLCSWKHRPEGPTKWPTAPRKRLPSHVLLPTPPGHTTTCCPTTARHHTPRVTDMPRRVSHGGATYP